MHTLSLQPSFLRTGPALALLVVLAAAIHPAVAQQKVKNFRVKDYTDDGKLKSELLGKEAVFFPGRPANITGLQIRFFDKDEKVNMTITSPQCLYRQEKPAKATSDKEVKIVGEQFIVEGKGFVYEHEGQRLEIHAKAKVTLKGLGGKREGLSGLPGTRAKKPEPTPNATTPPPALPLVEPAPLSP